jgi:hypothetical protein
MDREKSKRVVTAGDFSLRHGSDLTKAVDGLKISDTSLKLSVSCNFDISLHIESNEPIPSQLEIVLETVNLEPPVRLADETYDSKQGGVYQRHFKMNTLCSLLHNAVIKLSHPTLPRGMVTVDLIIK